MFRLAHISDIHLAPLPPVRLVDLLSKRITGYLNWKLNRGTKRDPQTLVGLTGHLKENSCDHIAVTGDLVNLSLAQEFTNARNWLEELGSPNEVSVVLGNHDTYVPRAIKRATQAWLPYLEGDTNRSTRLFPTFRRRGDVAIIGVNSGAASLPFMATGRFGRHQRKATAELLDEAARQGLFRVVLIHHPPFPGATDYHKRLIGAQRFRRMIAQYGAELILHGHTHVDSFNHIAGPDLPVPVIGVPSASKDPTTPEQTERLRPAGRYNLFEIGGSPGNWSCQIDEYGYTFRGQSIEKLSSRTIMKNGSVYGILEALATDPGEK